MLERITLIFRLVPVFTSSSHSFTHSLTHLFIAALVALVSHFPALWLFLCTLHFCWSGTQNSSEQLTRELAQWVGKLGSSEQLTGELAQWTGKLVDLGLTFQNQCEKLDMAVHAYNLGIRKLR